MSHRLHMIPRHEIDVQRWDDRVAASPNGLIYSESQYLDAMSENWMGIVSEDYTKICAVPWKAKFGIRYVYPPPYVQQSGVIGNDVSKTDLENCLTIMRSFARYGEYYFNFQNAVGNARNNFVLPLNKNYDAGSFPADFRYDLKKANASGLEYRVSHDHKSCIDLYHHYLQQKKKTGSELSDRLHRLADVYSVHNRLLIRDVTDASQNIVSSVLCLRDNKRIYLLLSATSPEGRKMRANHFLMDKLLQELMPSPLLLDFVGSDIEGVAHYYRNFTDIIQPYFLLKWNRLPLPLRWLKN